MSCALRAVARSARPQVAAPVLDDGQRRRLNRRQRTAGIGRLRGEAGGERRGDFRAALPRALAGEARALGLNETGVDIRSEEHTSELQSLMRISYAVFCLKKKKINQFINVGNIHRKNTIVK